MILKIVCFILAMIFGGLACAIYRNSKGTDNDGSGIVVLACIVLTVISALCALILPIRL